MLYIVFRLIVIFHCQEIAIAIEFQFHARCKFYLVTVEIVGIIAYIGNCDALEIGIEISGYSLRYYFGGNALVVLHFFPLSAVAEFDSCSVRKEHFIVGAEKEKSSSTAAAVMVAGAKFLINAVASAGSSAAWIGLSSAWAVNAINAGIANKAVKINLFIILNFELVIKLHGTEKNVILTNTGKDIEL